jgi:protein involved in polysaccharide export with SLBB domain
MMLVTSALLIVFAEAGVAQMDTQQRISSARGAAANTGLSVVPADFSQLKLAPGFLLSLNVLDDSDFVGTFRVDEQGDIFLPVLGTLHVEIGRAHV